MDKACCALYKQKGRFQEGEKLKCGGFIFQQDKEQKKEIRSEEEQLENNQIKEDTTFRAEISEEQRVDVRSMRKELMWTIISHSERFSVYSSDEEIFPVFSLPQLQILL